MSRRRAIGVLCMVKDPESDECCALLQIRGKINDEKGGPESFPGAAQVTVHGGVESDERLRLALAREVREEVESVLAHLGIDDVPDAYAPKSLVSRRITLHRLTTLTNAKKQMATMGCVIDDPNLFRLLIESLPASKNLPLDHPSFRVVREAELDQIKIIDPGDPIQKKEGFSNGELAMFGDELEAVRRAFQKI